MRDLKQNKSYIVDIDLLAVRPDKLRMDIATPAGFSVATFTMNAKEVRYALAQSKEFFAGKPGDNVLKPIIPIAVDPRALLDIIFDHDPAVVGWSCKRDKDNFINECVNSKSNVKVSVADRELHRKNLFITAPSSSVQMNFKGFQPKVQWDEGKFRLDPPSGFKSYTVKE